MTMRIPLAAFLFAFALVGLCLPVVAAPGTTDGQKKITIVDTKFDQVDGNNKLRIIAESAEEPKLPVIMPTSVGARGKTSVTGATEAATGVLPPYASFKGTEDVNTGGEIYWDLRALALKSGKYALSCQVTPQDVNVDGLHLQVVMSGEDSAWIWPQNRPACIRFDKAVITTDDPASVKIPYTIGVTSTLLVEFDMDALTWCASVDGKELLKPTTFKQLFNPGSGLMVGGIFLRNYWHNVAVSNMKLERLEGNSTPAVERTNAANNTRIAWVGDSITQGYGLGNSGVTSPPGVLRRLLAGKAMVGNFGISGTTILKSGDSPYWKQAAYTRAMKYEPNVVIIALGTNDSKTMNWAHSTEIAGDMAAMVTAFKNLPSKPTVIVVMPVPVFKPIYGITEELLAQVRPLLAQGALQAGATVVDSAATFAGQDAMFPDGVHPNEKGAELIAQLVAKNLPPQQDNAKETPK